MAKKKKSERRSGKHPGAITSKEQSQTGRTTSERRQNETPMRNDEEQQKPGDRFPRDTYEGGRENPKVY